MSANIIVVFFLALLSTFSPFPLALSSHTTAVLDVSASTKRAHNAISLKNYETSLNIPSNSSFFSLPLHPRLSLHKDYESLVNSRLARDAARVQLLNHKLSLALSESELRPEDVGVPVRSGKSAGSGEYFARIGVGQPVQSFYLVPDTGSDVSWLQCQPCESCYDQSDPIFDPTSSSSYNSLSCESQQCQALDRSACQDGKCFYQVSYGDGSFTFGEFATETLTFGNSESIPSVGIGCGRDNEGLFVGSAGILGLGGRAASLPSQIKSSSFSYCFVDRDSNSYSTLDFNSVQLGGSITTPLITNEKFLTFRYVEVTGLSVGGQPLLIPPSSLQIDESGTGGVIVDSGTIITRLQTPVYDALRDAFKSLTQNLPPAGGVSLFDTCYDLSSQAEVQVPTVAIQFTGGQSMRLPANNYLIRVDSAGTFCLAFAPTTSSLSIIGNFLQQGMRVSYDLANSVVGFSANQC